MKAKSRAKVPAMPAGYQSVTPYLCVRGAARGIAFYRKAFGARQVLRMPGPKGRIRHAEIEIAGHRVMLADEFPEIGFRGPKAHRGSPVHLHLYLPEVDKVVARALRAGAKLTRPVEDRFYGDRIGTLEDPFGHVWHVATHVEEVSPAEMKRRAKGKGS